MSKIDVRVLKLEAGCRRLLHLHWHRLAGIWIANNNDSYSIESRYLRLVGELLRWCEYPIRKY